MDAVVVRVEVEQDLRRGRRLEIVAAGGGGAPEGGLGGRDGHRDHGLVEWSLGPVIMISVEFTFSLEYNNVMMCNHL